MPKTAVATACKYYVYAIELDPSVLKVKAFRDANPGASLERPPVYVGMTGRTPGLRFQQHRAGYKSSRFPRHFGVRLRHDLVRRFGTERYATQDAAREGEARLALALREAGFSAWYN